MEVTMKVRELRDALDNLNEEADIIPYFDRGEELPAIQLKFPSVEEIESLDLDEDGDFILPLTRNTDG